MCSSLHNLPTELLIKVFKYLNIYDLCNLKLTCVRFKDIVNSSLHILIKNNFIATNQLHNIIKSRLVVLIIFIISFWTCFNKSNINVSTIFPEHYVSYQLLKSLGYPITGKLDDTKK